MSNREATRDEQVKCADCVTFIRYRLEVIDKLSSRKITTGYEIPDLESIGLQFRMIFEMISMSSICANKEYCQEARRRFDKLWNAAEIIRFVESINPKLYPVPLKRKINPASSGGEVTELADGYLTKDELIEAYGRCGDLLHASNPYGTGQPRCYRMETSLRVLARAHPFASKVPHGSPHR